MNFIRKVDGQVIEKGIGATPAWLAARNEQHPGEYFEDDGNTPLSPTPAPSLPDPAQAMAEMQKADPVLQRLDAIEKRLVALEAKAKKTPLKPKKGTS